MTATLTHPASSASTSTSTRSAVHPVSRTGVAYGLVAAAVVIPALSSRLAD